MKVQDLVYQPPVLSDEELFNLAWFYCIVCREMKNATRTGGWIGSLKMGGTYCRYHSEEELATRLTLDSREGRV